MFNLQLQSFVIVTRCLFCLASADAEKYHPPSAPKSRSLLADDPRGTPWMKKEKPFKSVMSNKWTNFTSGGELGTTTGVKSHGIYASKVDVTTDEQNQSTYSAADYGYGNDSQEVPPPPAPPAQQQFDPNMYGYGTGYEPAPAPYTDPNYTYPYGGYGYGAGGYY